MTKRRFIRPVRGPVYVNIVFPTGKKKSRKKMILELSTVDKSIVLKWFKMTTIPKIKQFLLIHSWRAS